MAGTPSSVVDLALLEIPEMITYLNASPFWCTVHEAQCPAGDGYRLPRCWVEDPSYAEALVEWYDKHLEGEVYSVGDWPSVIYICGPCFLGHMNKLKELICQAKAQQSVT